MSDLAEEEEELESDHDGFLPLPAESQLLRTSGFQSRSQLLVPASTVNQPRSQPPIQLSQPRSQPPVQPSSQPPVKGSCSNSQTPVKLNYRAQPPVKPSHTSHPPLKRGS